MKRFQVPPEDGFPIRRETEHFILDITTRREIFWTTKATGQRKRIGFWHGDPRQYEQPDAGA